MGSAKFAQFTAFNLWVGVAASTTAWGLALWPFGSSLPRSVPVVSMSSGLNAPSAQNIAKVLGANVGEPNGDDVTAASSLASRLVLFGVAKLGNKQAVALIAVDGQPVKAFHQGQEVLPGWVMQSVSTDQAMLGSASHQPSWMTLSLPKTSAVAE